MIKVRYPFCVSCGFVFAFEYSIVLHLNILYAAQLCIFSCDLLVGLSYLFLTGPLPSFELFSFCVTLATEILLALASFRHPKIFLRIFLPDIVPNHRLNHSHCDLANSPAQYKGDKTLPCPFDYIMLLEHYLLDGLFDVCLRREEPD